MGELGRRTAAKCDLPRRGAVLSAIQAMGEMDPRFTNILGRIRNMKGLSIFLFIGPLLGVVLLASQSEAVILKPGDILVNPQNRVEVIDPNTGIQTLISQGGFWTRFGSVWDLAVFGTEKIYTVGSVDLPGGGVAMGVVEVDPATGNQRLVTSGGNFTGLAWTIAVEANGSILVADHRCCNPGNFGGGVIRINPVTGAQSILASGGFLIGAHGVHVGPNGDIFVGTQISGSGVGPGVVRINPQTGAQSIVAFGDEPGVPPHGVSGNQ